MVKPVLIVADDEKASLRSLAGELESRYGEHYRIVASSSAQETFARLAELRAEGARVPVILADQWMPGSTGAELLARAKTIYPTARRGLLISWGTGRPPRRSSRRRPSGRWSSSCPSRHGRRMSSSTG